MEKLHFFSTRYFQIAWLRRCVITLFAFVLAFTHCVFSNESCMSWVCIKGWKVIFLAFIWLFLMCVFKCLLMWLVRVDAKSHWLHLFALSPVCVFKYSLRLSTLEDFTSLWFFSNVSNVYSNAPHERIHSHIGYICFSSVCVFKFCMGIWNVLKCKGIKILNPKHIWKT